MNALRAKYAQLISQYSDKKKSIWGSGSNPAAATNLTSEIVDLILSEAVTSRASDIHLEPSGEIVKVRFRVDGKLYEVVDVQESPSINIIPRIKILANLPTDTVSSRKAHDGRFSAKITERELDFRVATFPTVKGEKVAIRILNKDLGMLDLKKVGMTPQDLILLDRIVQRKRGIVIVSGPTGSGKTTTLYSILHRLHTPHVNIVTLEDPVEYQMEGINQCDIKSKDNEDFAAGLKAILRQDPDVILIGEIRDKESAEIAIRASITGHQVLTSLHANSALGTVHRLMDMGLERHLLAYAMTGAIAQRLVRRICSNCKTAYRVEFKMLQNICLQTGLSIEAFTGVPGATGESSTIKYEQGADAARGDFIVYKGSGCDLCAQTGYLGRMGIFEVVPFTEELRHGILHNASMHDLEIIAARKGSHSLALDAIQKVKSGHVTLDDIYPILLEKS